jgi:hypothetical protein
VFAYDRTPGGSLVVAPFLCSWQCVRAQSSLSAQPLLLILLILTVCIHYLFTVLGVVVVVDRLSRRRRLTAAAIDGGD